MKQNRTKRNKAWLGAVIGAVTSLAGSAISSASNAKARQEAYEEQQKAQNKADTYQMAQNLSNAYSNQEYVKDFLNKVQFKNGGKMKTKSKYSDRLSVAKKYKCGGRKKAEWGASDTNAVISGLNSGLSSVINAALSNNGTNVVKRGLTYTGTTKDGLKQPDYVGSGYYARFGCARKRKCVGGMKKGRR